MKQKKLKKSSSNKKHHPHHTKVPHDKNYRAMWVIGLIIFVAGIILDNLWIIIPGGFLAIYGIMNRHSWHLHHIK